MSTAMQNSLRHLATSFGQHFLETFTLLPETTNHKCMVTSTFLSSNNKHDFCYTMANISPSHIQQCLNLTMHFSLRHLAAKMLSPLSHNFISFPYFFTYYQTSSINVNSLFHAAIKNLHIKVNGIFVFFILLYFTTLSEGITYTRKNTFPTLKIIIRLLAKNLQSHALKMDELKVHIRNVVGV